MLIHHFGAETQGFQGLVDQYDRAYFGYKWANSAEFGEKRKKMSELKNSVLIMQRECCFLEKFGTGRDKPHLNVPTVKVGYISNLT